MEIGQLIADRIDALVKAAQAPINRAFCACSWHERYWVSETLFTENQKNPTLAKNLLRSRGSSRLMFRSIAWRASSLRAHGAIAGQDRRWGAMVPDF